MIVINYELREISYSVIMNKTPQIIHLPETESTNQLMRSLSNAESLPNKSIIWADCQTKGRGQAGNSWESELGKNLLFSILFYPDCLPANRPFSILEIAALSVKYTLDKYVPDITVKWPNDIYWKNKKISGILIENDLTDCLISRSIIGIGINLNQSEFRSGALNPVSLSLITGQTYDRKKILDQVFAEFEQLVQCLQDEGPDSLHRRYCTALYRRDGFYTYQDAEGCFEARIHAIEPAGQLILERRDGRLSGYAFKEVVCL
jgi:BirA family biotin operon repressor/biotin-[acetyl-CoA-carboxylase] ligase